MSQDAYNLARALARTIGPVTISRRTRFSRVWHTVLYVWA
jgi:hypothetical protein